MDSPAPTLRYRYPGVKPFTTEEQDLFFGRDTDINDLFSLIFVRQMVVLYGKSGYGKSSLINAGIISKLQQETNFVYFPIRFNNYSGKLETEAISPTETVRRRLSASLTTDGQTNSSLDALIPREDSFWYWIKIYQEQRQQTQFILFFDQFEELFTYPQEQIAEFSVQLAQLLYPTIAAPFEERMMELAEANQLPDAIQDFLYQKPTIKVLFSVRSDRLSLLNSLTDRHPAILQYCYELDALNRLEAVRAITQPAQLPQSAGYGSPVFKYASDAITAILDNIANPQDGKIESATLQIICRYVEDELVAQRPDVVISCAQLGNITDIFQKYYEGILHRLPRADRQKAQQLIEEQLIGNGRRNPLSETYILHKFAIDPNLLDQLEKTSLLRKERDANGRLLYEVSHDTLVGAIERVATSRWAVEEEIKRKQLEQEITEEKARAIRLQELMQQAQTSEQKAVHRSQFAAWLATAAILIAGLALYLYFEGKAEKERAKLAEQKANNQSVQLEHLFINEQINEAFALYNSAKAWMNTQEYKNGLDNLRRADSIVNLYTGQNEKFIFSHSNLRITKQSIKKRIDSLNLSIKREIKICKTTLNNS